MSDEEAPVVSGEKKRGRPAGDKEKAVEAKKRPRTSSSEASEGKKVVENGNLPAKRGRGRPKAPVKAVATKGRAEKKTSRGRGRPKAAGKKTKSSSSESDEEEDDDDEEDENDAEDSDE
ncbi:nucleolin-like [Phlebotomus papatasi]|uniref:nucleolin-like n=1 Tax=Phlebotomus papatasi TaxID=29031 RepID=UPI002483848A|nr:nucleolin-like [Phlebotomus papatasi]